MKNCLVVDDSRLIRKIACRLLEEMRFQTVEAMDCTTALDACRNEMPDAVLVDLNLPNGNCLEFLRALRRERDGACPVVVFATTENDVTQISEALSAGANEYLMKPFDRASLEAKFAQIGLA